MQQTHKHPLFSTPLVTVTKCDLCMKLELCVYVESLDNWICNRCIEILVCLLELCNTMKGEIYDF